MSWKDRTPEEKYKWLDQQMEEIHKAKELLARFERVTEKWLKKVSQTKEA